MNSSRSLYNVSVSSLPRRVLAVETIPPGRRLNIYSTPEYLGYIANLLQGTPEWDRLRTSQFGKLFNLPVTRCAHSGKLLHALLCRQLITKKVHELWFVYGGKPFRFSLREFHLITGLVCDPLPSKATIEHNSDTISMWNQLFGTNTVMYVEDVVKMLESDKQMSPNKRFCLALILLVDGVVVCKDKYKKITREFVEMLNDIEHFLSYPWGRKSFIATIGRFGPPQGSQTPIADLIVRLKQKTSATYGFPLALQLQAFEAIPLLLEKIPNYSDIRGFANRPSQRLSCTVILHQGDVLAAEMDPKLVVSYTLSPLEDNIEGNFSWDNENPDPSVDILLELIQRNHSWCPSDWSVGDIPILDCSVGDSTIPIEQATKTTETVNVQTLKPPSRKLATRKGNRATTRQTKPQDIDDVAPDGIEGLKKFILEQNGLLFERIMGELDKRIPPREESLSKGNESKRKRVVESKGSKRKKPERQYINITSDSDGDMDPPVE